MPSLIRAEPFGDRVAFKFPFDRKIVTQFKLLPGAHWHGGERAWIGSRDLLPLLKERHGKRLKIDRKLKRRGVAFDIRLLGSPDGKLSLYPYQVEGVNFLHERDDGSILADAPGVGKTVQEIVNAVSKQNRLGGRVFVLYPSNARGVWRKELMKWTGRELYECEGKKHRRIVKGLTPEARRDAIDLQDIPTDAWIGCHYEIIDPWVHKLIELGGNVLICDEIHHASNRRIPRTQAVFLLSTNVKTRSACSGTLLRTGPRNLWATGEIVRPGMFGGSWGSKGSDWEGKYVGYSSYAYRYCDAEPGEYGGLVDSGSSNLDELKARLSDLVLRRERADVLDQLPPSRRQIIEIEPTTADYAKYLAHAKKILPVAASKKGKDRERILESLQGLVDGMKIPHAVDLVVDVVNGGEKVLILSHFHDTANLLEELLTNKVKTFFAPGYHSPEVREVEHELFRQHKGAAVLVANTMSTREAVDLTVASRLIFTTLEWVPDDLVQAESRLIRHGQSRGVLIQYLVCPSTIDLNMATALFGRQRVGTALFGEDPQAASMAEDFREAGYVDESAVIGVSDDSMADEVLASMLADFSEQQAKAKSDSALVGGNETDFLLEDDE